MDDSILRKLRTELDEAFAAAIPEMISGLRQMEIEFRTGDIAPADSRIWEGMEMLRRQLDATAAAVQSLIDRRPQDDLPR